MSLTTQTGYADIITSPHFNRLHSICNPIMLGHVPTECQRSDTFSVLFAITSPGYGTNIGVGHVITGYLSEQQNGKLNSILLPINTGSLMWPIDQDIIQDMNHYPKRRLILRLPLLF